jgi:hypothetical protein
MKVARLDQATVVEELCLDAGLAVVAEFAPDRLVVTRAREREQQLDSLRLSRWRWRLFGA